MKFDYIFLSSFIFVKYILSGAIKMALVKFIADLLAAFATYPPAP